MPRVYKRGNKWAVDYRDLDGRRVRRVVSERKREAEFALAGVIDRIKHQKWGLPTGPDKRVSEFTKEFLTHIKAEKSPKTSSSYESKLNRFNRFIDQKFLRKVTKKDIENFKVERLNEVTPAAVAGDLRTLNLFFNQAREWSYIEENPCRGIKKPRMIAQNKPEFLSKEEARKLLDTAKDTRIFPMIATGLYAGLRLGEMARLEWADIDRGVINVRSKEEGHTKSHKARTIPIAPALMTILDKERKSSGHCFWQPEIGYPYDAYRRELRRVCEQAGVKCGWHILRKTFGSHLAMAGVDLISISRLLGHSDIQITVKSYAHLSKDHLAGAVDKLDFGL